MLTSMSVCSLHTVAMTMPSVPTQLAAMTVHASQASPATDRRASTKTSVSSTSTTAVRSPNVKTPMVPIPVPAQLVSKVTESAVTTWMSA